MEAKGEGKYDDDDGDAKRTGGDAKAAAADDFDENELLMMVAADADNLLFGEDAELMRFVGDHASEWIEAVEGERDGSGSPVKAMSGFRTLHGESSSICTICEAGEAHTNNFIRHATIAEFLQIMETHLTTLVEKNGGTLDSFMEDCQRAMNGGAGFLFEDENCTYFQRRPQSMFSSCSHSLASFRHYSATTTDSEFVEHVNAMGDFEAFHKLMMKACTKQLSIGGK